MDPNFDSQLTGAGRTSTPTTEGNFTFGDFALFVAQCVSVVGAGFAVGMGVYSLIHMNFLAAFLYAPFAFIMQIAMVVVFSRARTWKR